MVQADGPGAEVGSLSAALAEIAARGGGPVRWWVAGAVPADTETATAHGLGPERDLYQMRRPLPAAPPPALELRSFVAGTDEADWVAVNNRAFEGHPEQGAWTVEDVQAREVEPWFDAAGFLLHHDPATTRLAGFCWTKVHGPLEPGPALGEIYVIAVDPDYGGRGLGRALTLAGLDHLHRARDIGTAMLYVDAGNTAAVTLYRRLGFVVHRTDRAFAGLVPSA
ncbi:MAG: mycothiol synthase [Acidimicrobiia bacterium]